MFSTQPVFPSSVSFIKTLLSLLEDLKSECREVKREEFEVNSALKKCENSFFFWEKLNIEYFLEIYAGLRRKLEKNWEFNLVEREEIERNLRRLKREGEGDVEKMNEIGKKIENLENKLRRRKLHKNRAK